MRTQVLALAAIAAALAMGPAAHAAANSAAASPQNGAACFASNTWQGWSPINNGGALLLRINTRDIYRVDLNSGSHVRKQSDQFLVNRVRGSDWICSALDLSLSLSDHHGFRQPLIATSMRKLSAEEIAAIPKEDLP